MQKFKVNGQSVPKIEWKQTDGRTEAIALAAALMRSVINKKIAFRFNDAESIELK